jgi:hypothetical protein
LDEKLCLRGMSLAVYPTIARSGEILLLTLDARKMA